MYLPVTLEKSGASFINKKKQQPFFSPAIVQPKLIIGPVDDSYEREADAMADRVMRMTDNDAVALNSSPAIIQKKCAACEEEEKLQRKEENEDENMQKNQIADVPVQRKCAHCEEEEKNIHRKESINNVPDVTPSVHQTLQSRGQSLDHNTRSFMESRFGYDFSNVQIHNDSLAHQSSSDINALAYTHGNHVVFGVGQYQPNTGSGKQLLAHELTHVVQQSKNIQPKIQRLGDLSKVPPMACDVANTSAPSPASTSLFPTSSTTLTTDQTTNIASFVITWKANGASDPLRVDGYASTVGTDELNWQLSCDRALSVANELRNNGVPDSLITIFAQGETTEFGAQKNNQRADISILSSPPPPPLTCAGGATPQSSVAACIQPIVVAENDGSRPLTAPSFSSVQSIWGKCCMNITVNSTITVNNSSLKEIDDAGSNAPMTAEERTLFATAGSGCIPVATVDTIRRGSDVGKQVAGGGTTKDFLTNNPKVIVVEGTDPTVVAHEVGHAFTCLHTDDVGNNTVMHPSGAHNIPVPQGVTANICNKARSSPSALSSGVDQCCLDTI